MLRSWTALGASLGLSLGVLGVLGGTSGAATAGPPPAAARAPFAAPGGHGAVTAVDRYRLATGDTVRVLTLADGTRVPRLVGGGPFIWSGGPDHLYVVPRTAAAHLHRLDLSLFDTSALARVARRGRVPVVLRLRPEVAPASLTGLRRVPGTARAVGRSTVVHATLGPRFRGFGASQLRDIARVRLDAPRARAAASGASAGPTHTVRVHVTERDGSPADYALVTLQDTVDGDAFLEQATVGRRRGFATFRGVPDGEYSAVVQTFEAVLVKPELDVTADTTVEEHLADATVRPHVSLPGHRVRWTSLTVERDPERGSGIPFGYAGPHFDMRVQPTPAAVRHGALHTGVTATLVTGRTADGHAGVAVTGDVAGGVPSNLTFDHHRRDFARATDRFYGNGPAARRTLMVFPGNVHADISMGGETDLRVPVPGRLRVWFQAGPGSYAQQTLFPFDTARGSRDNTQVITLGRYRHAGGRPPVVLLHGPVGPGLETGPHRSGYSGAARQGDRLRMFVPLLGGAGGARGPAIVLADPRVGTWSLREGGRTLAHGREVIMVDVAVPHRRRTYRLTATTRPPKAWDLSTEASVRWTFRSRAGRSAVPLLTPRYVPPTDLAGNLAPGPTGFRLAFHSAQHSVRVARARVELSSDDGRTWSPVRMRRTSALTFRVTYDNPAADAVARYASLRVTARDAHGNTVRETVIHAYRLRGR